MPLAEDYSFDEDELRSSHQDLSFQARFELRWLTLPAPHAHHDPRAALRDHIRRVAGAICGEEPVTRARIVEDRINARLGNAHDLDKAPIRLLWASARIIAPTDVIAIAKDRELHRNQARLREEKQQQQIQRVEAFRSRVLSDPGMALAYWFMKHPGDPSQNSYTQVEQLACRVASYDPDKSWVQIALVVQEFVRDLTDAERRDSIDALRYWFRRYRPEFESQLPEGVDLGRPNEAPK
jgi:hypothetical protein